MSGKEKKRIFDESKTSNDGKKKKEAGYGVKITEKGWETSRISNHNFFYVQYTVLSSERVTRVARDVNIHCNHYIMDWLTFF